MERTITQVDVRGEVCPYPMLKAAEAMKRAKGEAAIEVLTDHAPALITVPHQAKKLGFSAVIEDIGTAQWKIRLERTAD